VSDRAYDLRREAYHLQGTADDAKARGLLREADRAEFEEHDAAGRAETLRQLLASPTGEKTVLSIEQTRHALSVRGSWNDGTEETQLLAMVDGNDDLARAFVAIFNAANALSEDTSPEGQAAFARLATHLPGDGDQS